jgi:hypothetical protein
VKVAFFEEKHSVIATFRHRDQGGARQEAGFSKSSTSCLTTSQIWFITLMDGGQSTYLTKLEEGGKKDPCKLVGIIYQVCPYFSFLS